MRQSQYSAVAKRLDEIAKTSASNIHIDVTDDNRVIINPCAENEIDKRVYIPSTTFEKLHSDDSMVKVIMGPYGSGKTTGCLIDALINVVRLPRCRDGVRRARLLIARNTYPELHSTTIPTWCNWFGELGKVTSRQKPFVEYFHEFNDANGKISLHVLFIAFAGVDDIKKLKSFEPTFAVLEELSELDKSIFDHAKGRVGRWPSEQICAEKFSPKIVCATNPPDESHWIYNIFEIEQPQNHILFKQPPALLKNKRGDLLENPEAENIEHLNRGYDYYFDMATGQTQEFIKVFVMGQYGMIKAGQLVYNDYNDDFHAVQDIEIDENEPITITIDYGTISPAILISQYVNDQLRCIKEFCGRFVTIKELWEFFALPWLQKHAPENLMQAYGDPANTYDGRQQLEECGLIVTPAPSNKIDKRLGSVVDLLTRFIDGHPRVIISKTGCPNLRAGFLQKYVYKEIHTVTGTAYKDVPEKNHPYSDIQDCLQYAALLVSGGLIEMESEYDEALADLRRQRLIDERNRVSGY